MYVLLGGGGGSGGGGDDEGVEDGVCVVRCLCW